VDMISYIYITTVILTQMTRVKTKDNISIASLVHWLWLLGNVSASISPQSYVAGSS